MSKELVIASNRHETKVAILEEDQLVEIYYQRGNEYSLAGSIHKGRVTRVLPGMQSAFVDLGLERDTFLYVSDFFEENEDIDTVAEEKPSRPDRRDRSQPRPLESVPVVTAPPIEVSAPAAAPATEVALGEEGIPAALTSEPSPESAEPGRQDADRGPRNDRRGRRSRRRRSRGRGFPENKYASPVPAAQDGAPSATEPEAEFETDEESDETAEVIILPGESLAKYRQGATATPERPRPAFSPTASPEVAPEVAEVASEEIAEQAGIEERARELELADKILSQRGNRRPELEEHKIEVVRHDEPASPFVVSDIDTEDEPPTQLTEEADAARFPQGVSGAPDFPQEPASAPPTEEPHSGPVTEPAAQPLSGDVRTESPVEALRVEAESEVHTDAGAADEGAIDATLPDGLSAAEHAEDEVAPDALENLSYDAADFDDVDAVDPMTPSQPETEGEPAVQSAQLRDQGGKYMHRVSRRMRRRRGGNRFGQPQQAFEGAASGAAAATALLPHTESRPEQREPEERSAEKPERALPSISELLKPGQEIIVQIAKEPLGQKGARITSHVALPGRYVVFMPSVAHLGVSRKIASDEERQRLKRILQKHRSGTTGGFIVRTAGEGIPEDEIAADMDFLYKLWLDIRQKAEKRPAPLLLHCDLDVVQRVLRDQVTEEFKAIWVDTEDMYENVLRFVQRFQPALVGRVKMYTREAPIYDQFGITQELEKALRPKVWLKSGGYIVINQTEALVAIDINTGKYVGKSNRLEDTIVKTNLEAAKEIVRQIRLRDLGGIIVVDFIDMDERKNRQRVMQALEEAMQTDKAPYKVLQFNDFGLVAITRKRVKQSLERTLCSPCPYCEAAGYVKSVQTVISEILVEAQKIRKAIEGKDALLRVHPEVAKVLKANDNKYLEELEEILGRPVLVKGDPALHHEKFDLG
ncbi:MAG: Rne/Rng family ribonuclease [Acidobacteriaceae bacterium]|nr:Rne/Rng family ribonuclease [Acidobacteriaceae bacterium]